MFESRRELLLSAALAASVALLLDHWLRRRGRGTGKDALARELARLEARAEAVREALAGLDEPPQREVRIWMDGAFDMMHYGHANAFRKGRALGTHLIVGVNDDESILRCKGAPPASCRRTQRHTHSPLLRSAANRLAPRGSPYAARPCVLSSPLPHRAARS